MTPLKKTDHNLRNIQYYDQFANKRKNVNLLSFNRVAEYEFGKIKDRLNLSKPKTIIELGCGMGRYALALAHLGHQVTAVDISRKSLQILNDQAKKNKLTQKLKTLKNDFTQTVFENKFEIGICISTYHVLAKREKERIEILSNFVKSIKQGGTLLIVEPNPFNPLLYLFYLFYPNVQKRDMKEFAKSSPFRIKKVLEQIGMENISINYVGFFPHRFMKWFPKISIINEIINNTPILKIFSSFSYITAVKR